MRVSLCSLFARDAHENTYVALSAAVAVCVCVCLRGRVGRLPVLLATLFPLRVFRCHRVRVCLCACPHHLSERRNKEVRFWDRC